jgi:hypothetical protein
VAAIDAVISSMSRRLGGEDGESRQQENRRELELERAVFGNTERRSTAGAGKKGAGATARKTAGMAKRARELSKRKR